MVLMLCLLWKVLLELSPSFLNGKSQNKSTLVFDEKSQFIHHRERVKAKPTICPLSPTSVWNMERISLLPPQWHFPFLIVFLDWSFYMPRKTFWYASVQLLSAAQSCQSHTLHHWQCGSVEMCLCVCVWYSQAWLGSILGRTFSEASGHSGHRCALCDGTYQQEKKHHCKRIWSFHTHRHLEHSS